MSTAWQSRKGTLDSEATKQFKGAAISLISTLNLSPVALVHSHAYGKVWGLLGHLTTDEGSGPHPCAIRLRMNGAPKMVWVGHPPTHPLEATPPAR